MSMRDYPCSGYVLSANKVLKILPESCRELAQDLIEDGDWEGLQEYLRMHLPPQFPQPAEVFLMSDEDTSDDLERGKLYCRWDEEQLYEKIETKEMVSLREVTDKPEFCHWSMWG